ncbi:MAG: hypothetical protein NC254_08520 [bacterium]|nr:hypothetical protein [bacterium]
MSGIKRSGWIAAAGVWLSAVFLGLWFAGSFSFGGTGAGGTETGGAGTDTGGMSADAADGLEADAARIGNWEIIFSGMKFTIPQKGKALVHESGCLNIRQTDAYLLQIVLEEGTLDTMWEGMGEKQESLAASGYRMEKEAERLTGDGRDQIRYRISLGNERGSDYERTYFAVMLAPADEGRHFLAVLCYDGVDMEHLELAERDRLYEEAFAAAETVLSAAQKTDETDDEAGSFWMEDVSLTPERPYLSEDAIIYQDGQYRISYQLPEDCMLISDNIAGKTYLDTVHQVYVQTNVMRYAWRTAKEMAEQFAAEELSRIHTQGEVTVNGRTFYYYSQSVMEYAKAGTEMHYYFHAYCDLDDGSVYYLYGRSDEEPAALEESYYFDWMNLHFSGA